MKWIVLIAGIVLASQANAENSIIFNCGASSGNSYYPPSILTGSENGEWVEDGIRGGKIQLVMNDGQLDIMHVDAGGINSARSYNAEIYLIDVTSEYLTIMVDYKGATKEIYTYDKINKNLYWSQHKFGTVLNKLSAFVSNCD